VQARDTLSSVAAKFDMSVSELKKLNRIMSSHIFTGQKLTVPVKDITECNTTHMPHAVSSDSALTVSSNNNNDDNSVKFRVNVITMLSRCIECKSYETET
jgi:LysM repeat protein